MTRWTAKRIKTLRLALGLTQEKFAKRLATTIATVSRYENNHRYPRLIMQRELTRLERNLK